LYPAQAKIKLPPNLAIMEKMPTGSESEWKNIEVGKYNDIFDTAVIHYNSK